MQLRPHHLMPNNTSNPADSSTPTKPSCSEFVFTILVIVLMLVGVFSQPFLPGH